MESEICMNIYPAIDLYEGKVVRLERGDFQKETVYSLNPEDIACEWENQGAQWIHVVDLEGAKTGVLKNRTAVSKIRKSVRCKIQFGGGLRTLETIREILQEGIERVVLGTKSLDKIFLKKALEKYGNPVAVGIDVRDKVVQMEGWARTSGLSLQTAIQFLNEFSLGTMIYTDIQRDGTLEGPNFAGLKEVLQGTPARVILSGGVGRLEDIQEAAGIAQENFEGVIVGKALYEKRFTLAEAIGIGHRMKG
jgi:phosphoribosylformimino-5-aminoimidazole carboxamide ribotide isomerase